MQKMNFNNRCNNEFMAKLIEFNKNCSLLKNLIEEENKFDPKYKTELCKKFQSTGKCPYGYVALDMMKGHLMKLLFHIFIYNYFYLNNIISCLLGKNII